MRIKENLKLRQVGNRYMIVDAVGENVNLTNVYTLNDTAAWLWNYAAGKDFSENDLVEELLNNFEVEKDLADKDVHTLLNLWRQFDLLIE